MDSQHGKLRQLFEYNFLEYTSYVIKERAIPDINDGLKPVQRRILQTLHNMDDGRFHKVANVVGATMKLHPHGDQSIFAALVNLANKGYLIERQGNYGNIFTGDAASAPRYIECRLSPLAREIMFHKEITTFVDSYDGRMQEPVTLPCKIPLLLLQGAEGIAVGMATKIMPHNFCELLLAQKQILRGEDFTLYPDFPQGGIVDVSLYDHGNGKIRCRARMEEANEKTILIKEIPYTTTTQSLIDSVEKAAKSGKIKIISINDYSAEDVEIEIKLARGIYAKDTIKALYAFTDCEVPISPNLTLVQDGVPRTSTVEEVLHHNTEKLLNDLTRKLTIDKDHLEDRLHARLLEQIFIEERIYKSIEEKTSYKDVIAGVALALKPFSTELDRAILGDDIERLLEIRIKRISRYDINKQKKEIKSIRSDIKGLSRQLRDMVGFTVDYIDALLKKYGDDYPRLTLLREFTEVSVRKVALSNLTVCYDRTEGFLGHQLKVSEGDSEFSIPCSEYDRLILIYETGKYKVIQVTDKLFVGHDIRWIGKMKKDLIFNMVYREGRENLCYVKRFASPKFILDKEYRLFDDHKRSKVLFLSFGTEKSARASLMPSPRAKTNMVEIVFDEYLVKGSAAKGKRVSTRIVRRVVDATGKKPKEKKKNLSLPGMKDPSFDKGSPDSE